MADGPVKRKVHFSVLLAILAAATFGLSWAGAFPRNWVEHAYSRRLFPTISHIVGMFADAVPFSWFDVAFLVGLGFIVHCLRRSNIWGVVGLGSVAYLWFFWSWGINYQRETLETRLGMNAAAIDAEQVDRLAEHAASELNRLWPIVAQIPLSRDATARLSADRVRTVVARIDGTNWVGPSRIKHSVIAQGWFRIAGIDGMFNPYGHEPILTSSLLRFELPFVMTHELAHAHGIPDEGDANMVATLATLASDDPTFQYSGWFHLWLYMRNDKRDKLLDLGPRRDLQFFVDRVRSEEVPWASRLQSTILDWHLKANRVGEGVSSYSRFLKLVVATQDRLQDFR